MCPAWGTKRIYASFFVVSIFAINHRRIDIECNKRFHNSIKNQVSVLDEKIPLLSFAVDFVTAYEYQKARGIKIHPGLWKDMRVDIFLVKKEN